MQKTHKLFTNHQRMLSSQFQLPMIWQTLPPASLAENMLVTPTLSKIGGVYETVENNLNL